ncbi:MAG: penicillin acylase family protein [Solirubrobacterales bacterium]|nr:penicillin acylase family protein [Solirubrobacterales bacterium]
MRRLLSVFAVLVFGFTMQAANASAKEYAATSLNIIPSGQWGSIPAPAGADSQALMYDALTPLFNNVTFSDIKQNFKSQGFGVGPDGPGTNEPVPYDGVTITRDKYNVPHVDSTTYDGGIWAAGWIAQEDRGILLAQVRYNARIAAIDVPNITAYSAILGLDSFVPSAETEEVVAQQTEALLAKGSDGEQALADIDTFLEGMNAYLAANSPGTAPWTRNDIYAINAFKDQFLGEGGGDEARRSQFLDGLQDRLGVKNGWKVFDDLAQNKNNGSPTSVDGKFPYMPIPQNGRAGTVIIDHDSYDEFDPVVGGAPMPLSGSDPRTNSSNTLMVTKKKSATNKPLMVGGPQIGYNYPSFMWEIDMNAPGLKWTGSTSAFAPGYLLIGRGEDFSNTLTSASADLIDQYAETLCGGSDTMYRYKGQCLSMQEFNAGTLNGDPVKFMTTVHGPVTGYATVDGTKVAISSKRSSYGKDVVDILFNQRLSNGSVTDVKSFYTAANQSPQTFNSFYIDNKHIAMFTSGRLPIRHPQVDPRLLTKGTGQYEWQGFLDKAGHMQGMDPKSGLMVNWNQTAAHRFAAADDSWGRNGSVARVDMLNKQLKKNRNANGKWNLPAITSAMNSAATQDVRAIVTVPLLRKLLNGSKPPTGQAGQMLKQMRYWTEKAGSRLDRNGDGLIDAPGAASMDGAWDNIANAFMKPQLGSQLDELNSLFSRFDSPPGGQYNGWYQYFDRDIKRLLGKDQPKPFKKSYCGKGDLEACQTAVWNAIAQSGQELTSEYGTSDPSQWQASATAEEITFSPINILTMAYTNRPSGYQQVVAYKSHKK